MAHGVPFKMHEASSFAQCGRVLRRCTMLPHVEPLLDYSEVARLGDKNLPVTRMNTSGAVDLLTDY